MRRAIFLTVLSLILLGAPPAVSAEVRCSPFAALIQARIVLDPDVSLPPVLAAHQNEFGWGGDVFGMVGSKNDYLGGWFYGKDDAVESTYSRANGRGRNGIYMFAFGTKDNSGFTVTDTFTLQLGQAVWTVDQHANNYGGNYKASGTMVDGTGIFEGATGNFTLHGDFSAWAVGESLVSAWNPVLEGSMCK